MCSAAPSAPRARWHLRSLSQQAQAPIPMDGVRRPEVAPGAAAAKCQAVACEPEACLAISRESGKTCPSVVWMGCLRLRRLQRGSCVEIHPRLLWGVGPLGKRKSGCRWPCLRFAPGGRDVGAFVRKAWKRQNRGELYPVPGLLAQGGGNMLTLQDFHNAARVALVCAMCICDAGLFTPGSLRRSMPTLTSVFLAIRGRLATR